MDDVLLRRYSKPVPRYTSYPTAPHFDAGVGTADYRCWLARIGANQSVSLYFHVPFCARMCWFCGCHTRVTRRDAPVADYAARLDREMSLVSAQLSGTPVARHVHWGGGTPNMLAPEAFGWLMDRARATFDVHQDAEIAVEIDPRLLRPDQVDAFAAAGVTRVSIGVQDFDPAVQSAVNRHQPLALVADAVDSLRSRGISRINLDLMYGLPEQTVESVTRSVDLAVSLQPDRVALFGYAHVPWMKANQRKIDETRLPDINDRFAQAEAAAARLVEHGFVRIGLDHFCHPADSMAVALREGTLRRNFQGYTTDVTDGLIGFGASAISCLPEGYVQNAVGLRDYTAAIDAGELTACRGVRISQEDRLRRAVIEQLMCTLSVDLASMCRAHGVEETHFSDVDPLLRDLAADGVVEIDGPHVRIPEPARPFMRSVCACFDAYLGERESRHSQAV